MNCNCCKKSNFQNLLDLGLQPYANKYPSKDLLDNEFKENLLISICLNCFTCNTNKIASRKEMFEEYFYLSSVNPELVNHFEELSKIIPNNSKLLDSQTILQQLSNPAVANQVLPALVNSGALPNIGINAYNSANASQKSAYNSQMADAIAGGNQKLSQVASNAISNLPNP